MKSISSPISVAIMAYSDCQLSAVYGLADMLNTASKQAQEQELSPVFQIDIVGPNAPLPETPLPENLTVMVFPPSLSGGPEKRERQAMAGLIKHNYQQGTLICSICAGAFILGESGLLDDRQATTHWGLADAFRQKFPRVKLNIDKLIIDEGDIITAGGIMAWSDLGLRLIQRFAGVSVMLAVARYFLLDPGGREQKFYQVFSPSFTHGEPAVLKVQHYLHSHFHKPVIVGQLAELAGLGQRTFLRRFHQATQMNPKEYIQHLRVGKARENLEITGLSIDQIAWQCGYQDPGAFRKVFGKIMGLTPGEYRQRFSTRQELT